jgi:alpha-tubulin suppressor-like RCC1 family protein
MKRRARRDGRLLVWSLIAASALALAATPQSQARPTRLTLLLPPSASTSAPVVASGKATRVPRRRRVLLQRLSGRRWRTLGSARVSHHRFKVVFTAPSRPGVLLVRAIIYRRPHRPFVSRPRRLVILGQSAAALLPPPTVAAGWGLNNHAQLGGGFKSAPSGAVPVRGVSGIKQLAASYFSSYALLNDGTVRAWGGDTWGQLGDGSHTEIVAHPVVVEGLTGVVAIAAGGAHAMALLSNGTVASWGGNSYGELGNGTTLKGAEGSGSTVPLIVPGLGGVVAIASGGGDDAALLSNGTVVAWGENKQGQLGDGTTVEKTVPTPVQGLTGVKAIAVGGVGSLGGHLLAQLNDGTVRAVGGNTSGQLGDGTTINRSSPVEVKGLSGVTQVSASGSHSLARLENGSVVAWGDNSEGELGISSGPESCGDTPKPCSRVPVATGLTNVSSVAAGFRFSLALSGGHVLAWGMNEYGQLGNGTTTKSSVPVPVSSLGEVTEIAAGEKHSLALLPGVGPASLVELTPGVGSLTVSWNAPPGAEPWSISWRPVAHPAVKWGPYLTLPPATRSYTITGLAAQPYEVVVRNKSFGPKIAIGTPLG